MDLSTRTKRNLKREKKMSQPEHKTSSYMTKQLNAALKRWTLNFDAKDLAHLKALANYWNGERLENGSELMKRHFMTFCDHALIVAGFDARRAHNAA